MRGPQIVPEFPDVASWHSLSSVVDLPYSGRSGDASCILLPNIKMIPMECTMRFIRYHPDDCMIEDHLSLLRIPDIPVGGWLINACIMQDIKLIPCIKIPRSSDDKKAVLRYASKPP